MPVSVPLRALFYHLISPTGTIGIDGNSILISISLTRIQPGTVPKAKSHLGDVDGHRLKQASESLPLELIQPLELQPFRQLDVSKAVQVRYPAARLFILLTFPL